MHNLFADLSNLRSLPEELLDTLVENRHVRIERIVSTGQSSQEDDWYDQDEAEWVLVLKGEAKLLLGGDDRLLHMKPGDYVSIPAHKKHRVAWTTPDEPTVWLAIFFNTD